MGGGSTSSCRSWPTTISCRTENGSCRVAATIQQQAPVPKLRPRRKRKRRAKEKARQKQRWWICRSRGSFGASELKTMHEQFGLGPAKCSHLRLSPSSSLSARAPRGTVACGRSLLVIELPSTQDPTPLKLARKLSCHLSGKPQVLAQLQCELRVFGMLSSDGW